MRRISGWRAAALALVLLALGATVPVDANETPAPYGYRIIERAFPALGVERLRMVRDGTPLAVNVARISEGAPVRLRTTLSHDRIAGGPPAFERTSSMCARVGCLVGVNGDFANLATGEPVGGLVAEGQFLRSPVGHHQQLLLPASGRFETSMLPWRATVGRPGLHELSITGVNVSRHRDQVVLYTGHWAPSTGTDDSGVEMLLRVLDHGGPSPVGRTLRVEPVELRLAGNTTIPPWGVVLSGIGAGAQAISTFWWQAAAGEAVAPLEMRIDAEASPIQSIGGGPVLLDDGHRVTLHGNRDLLHNRHPRTAVARTDDGTVLLVTVDGRQAGSVGMTLPELVELLESMGAIEALNLDGGGSSTFVADGIMVNHASDQLVWRNGRYLMVGQPSGNDIVVAHIERPVSSGLMVVPA